MKIKALLLLLLISPACFGNSWVRDVEVTKLGTFQQQSGHYVWLSGSVPECAAANPSNPILAFADDVGGGKAMMTVLTTALVAKRRIDVNVNGCAINEVHLK